MNLLVLEHIHKDFGSRLLLDDVSLGIQQGDKIGVVGINGTGKSTLLKIIAGLEEPDSGTVTKGNAVSLAYLPQSPAFAPGVSILDYAAEGAAEEDGWDAETRAKTMLNRLGFRDYSLLADHLSGGERKRAALARTLLQPADILILDEPTNHLDSPMVLWLEQYLAQRKQALVMVTHDRYFLDRVTRRIVEIDQGKLYSYEAGYTGFLELREQRLADARATERKRQTILRTELEWLHRGARARSTKQKAHIQRIEELQSQSGPISQETVQLDSLSSRLGKKTIQIENLTKSFGGRILFRDFSHIVLREERLGIIGPNGCGKSTLLKILMGQEQPDTGQVILGDTVRIGYFAQETPALPEGTRVIDAVRDIAEVIHTSQGTATASQMLERFLFPPAEQYGPVEKLSGGEKRRLFLLQVLMGAPNVLILDEPTNDLDIATLTILEDYLDSFSGIVIAVSHDRYFLDRTMNRILAFEGTTLHLYEGGYTDYWNSPNRPREAEGAGGPPASSAGKDAAASRQKPRINSKLRFTYKEQKEYETIEEDIAALEARLEQLEAEMEEAASQYARLEQLMQEKEEAEQALEEKMDRWVYLSELAQRIEEQG